MKVLVFCREFGVKTHTFIYQEIRSLAKAGHEVKVVCLQYSNQDIFPHEDVQVLPFSIPYRIFRNMFRRFGLSMNKKNPPLGNALKQIIRDFEPDIVHAHFGTDSLLFIDNYSSRDIPIFVSFHGADASLSLKDKLYVQRLKEIMRLPNLFPLAATHAFKRNFDTYGIPSEKVQVLHYGIDTDFFKRTKPAQQRDKKQITFVQVSSFREKKGHVYTLNALRKYIDNRPDMAVRIVFGGDGPKAEEIKTRARELELEPLIEYKGFVSKEQARDLLEEAHVFLHHSVTGSESGDMEGIPNAIIEAMSMELPVVSTYHSGIPELVESGVNGFLVAERDIEAYVNALEEVQHWGLLPENRKKVVDGFSNAVHFASLVAAYEKALAKLKN